MFSFKSSDQYLTQLVEKIKLYRVSKGITQQELEEMSGVSKRSISRLELGNSVQLDNLFKILLALDLGDNIDSLVPSINKRPSYYIASEKKQPLKRASKSRKTVTTSFSWGDES